MLQIPHIYWMKRARGSGMNLPAIVEGAAKLTVVHSNPKTRVKMVEEIGHVMHPYFRRNLEGKRERERDRERDRERGREKDRERVR